MNNEFQTKLKTFAALVEAEQIARLQHLHLGVPGNIAQARTSIKPGRKYCKVDVGTSGKYMVEVSTGNIFGIKGYGQVHLGHFYGTLDTTATYHWGEYYPVKKVDNQLQKANGCPAITHAPKIV